MSQHDMVIDNASGATARADINAALQALASTSSGNSAPATPYSGQLWLDTNTPSTTLQTLAIYDGTDWITLGYVDVTNNKAFSLQGGVPGTAASAGTVDLSAVYSRAVDVTGTTTITAITLAEGDWRIVRFTGALTLTHGSSLVLPGAANITTVAGDFAVFQGYGSSVVRCVGYFPTLAPPSEGTYTVALTCGTSGTITVNTSNDTGSYERHGNMVTVRGTVAVSSVSSPAGQLRISLPFAAANLAEGGNAGAGICILDGTVSSNAGVNAAAVSEGNTYMTCYTNTATSLSSLLANQIQAGTTVIFSATYRAA
ncbi:hypothetical protein J8F10_24040 [Gemmata sp. G18]|uniref:Uncharacterized protein n=1 Tax=Gemmata palustris TaxID=2822762 RepID=A0ABS5BX99_9BACT|nr:hypothetical protein [Gemmata palustris]MBP3958331.1 hypothetical protein [Gemmata palustris]